MPAKLNKKEATSPDIGVHEGPVKTKSRQQIKINVDYADAPFPQCMAVLDIVRCAIVLEDEQEVVIRAVYCHVLGNAYVMDSERAAVPESQFKRGESSSCGRASW